MLDETIPWIRSAVASASSRRTVENMDSDYLKATYETRFSDAELRDKQVLWIGAVREQFQQYVPGTGPSSTSEPATASSPTPSAPGDASAVDLKPDTADFAAPASRC